MSLFFAYFYIETKGKHISISHLSLRTGSHAVTSCERDAVNKVKTPPSSHEGDEEQRGKIIFSSFHLHNDGGTKGFPSFFLEANGHFAGF